jgi:hypothetical protein
MSNWYGTCFYDIDKVMAKAGLVKVTTLRRGYYMNDNAKILTLSATLRKDLPMRKEFDDLLVVIAISNVDNAALSALDYAKALSQDVLALHVCKDPTEKETFSARWKYLTNVPLAIVDSQKALAEEFIGSSHKDSIILPIRYYIEELIDSKPCSLVAVLIPEITSRRWWNSLNHSRMAQSIRNSLRHVIGVVTVSFPCTCER